MSESSTISSAVSTLDGVLAGIPSSSQALAALSTNYQPGQLSGPPASSLSVKSTILSAKSTIDAVLNRSGKLVTIHPWNSGETGEGRYSEQARGFLSTRNALRKLKEIVRVSDHGASSRVWCLVVAAGSLTEWEKKLSDINRCFPIGDLPFCERRAGQLKRLHKEKLTRKNGTAYPAFFDVSISAHPTGGEIKSLSNELAEVCRSYAVDNDPIREMQNLMVQKTAAVAASNGAWMKLKEKLRGLNGTIITGEINSKAELSFSDNFAGGGEPFCALVAVTGSDADIQLITEVFT